MNQEKLKQIVCIMEQVTDLLYQENIMPAYTGLVAVLPQLEEIIMDLDKETQQELTGKLQSALTAMESGDNTLLADILQYELIEQFTTYLKK